MRPLAELASEIHNPDRNNICGVQQLLNSYWNVWRTIEWAPDLECAQKNISENQIRMCAEKIVKIKFIRQKVHEWTKNA